MKLICGHGFNDRKYSTRKNGVNTKEYKLWSNVLRRCYCDKHKKRNPAYLDCTMSDEFKSFSLFHDWCKNQIGFNNDGWHLDKDLLSKGNKEYNGDLCVFLPREINNFLETRRNKRGDFPIGVFWNKDMMKYGAQVRLSGNQVNIGFFDNKIDAFNSYKKLKESHAKALARKYMGLIDDRAYKALIDFTVNIND